MDEHREPFRPIASRTSADALHEIHTAPGDFSFAAYAEAARRTAIYPERGNNIAYPALGLAGEAGEVANKVKKVLRDQDGTPDVNGVAAIADELGDVLWYVAAVAYEIGVPMESIARRNIEKLAQRKERGTLGGSGDSR